MSAERRWESRGAGRTGSERHGWARLGEVEPDLRIVDLGVVNGDVGALGEEVPHERNCGRLARVAGVCLECET